MGVSSLATGVGLAGAAYRYPAEKYSDEVTAIGKAPERVNGVHDAHGFTVI
jgi:hypothetical protein